MKHAAVVMMDLDNLKRTNDTFGHEWGDRYIHEAAVCFLRSIPEETLCARVSGDEFTILVSAGTTAARRPQQAIDRLVAGVRKQPLRPARRHGDDASASPAALPGTRTTARR